jgi:Fe2+ transport system protein FeoA
VNRRQSILIGVSTAGAGQGYEVVVADDGSIPAERLAALGVRPGSHLRIIVAEPAAAAPSFRGSLKGFPEPSWEDFERASEVARSDFELS